MKAGTVLRWGRGHLPPDLPPDSVVAHQIQKLADCSDVISEVPKCSKIQIFRGSAPDPAGAESLQRSPEPLTDGVGARSPSVKNPTPTLGPSGLVSMGLKVSDYRVGNPTNDRFQFSNVGLYEVRIFSGYGER